MKYTDFYESPLGTMLLAADEEGLTGIWFEDQKYYARGLSKQASEKELEIIAETKRWLDVYFAGKDPGALPKLHMIGTAFQKEVWDLLVEIPYGETTTYGTLAKKIAASRGIKRMSAQAVGGAVGHNPVSIIVPCHRVIGSDGSLTGYAGGLDKKAAMLALERGDNES